MIRYLIGDDQTLRLEQFDVSPSVYLDHWALRHISANENLRTRFTKSLLACDGTLVLSWLNLLEFTKVTDREQVELAEKLVEDILPNVFFMEINPFTVIDREDKLIAGGEPIPPHADIGFLKAFSAFKSTNCNPFTARGMFVAPHESTLSGRFDSLADTIISRTEALRAEMDTDSDFRSLIRRLPSGQKLQHGTRNVLRELARTFLIDRGLRLSRNNAVDLLHSVVPVAYCDLVLLDKHWEEQVDRMRTRLTEANLNIPIAKIFSRKANGINLFLEALEGRCEQ